jgi:hypothetical protein
MPTSKQMNPRHVRSRRGKKWVGIPSEGQGQCCAPSFCHGILPRGSAPLGLHRVRHEDDSWETWARSIQVNLCATTSTIDMNDEANQRGAQHAPVRCHRQGSPCRRKQFRHVPAKTSCHLRDTNSEKFLIQKQALISAGSIRTNYRPTQSPLDKARCPYRALSATLRNSSEFLAHRAKNSYL